MKRFLWLWFLIAGSWLFVIGLFLDEEHYGSSFGAAGLVCLGVSLLILIVRLILKILSHFSISPSKVIHVIGDVLKGIVLAFWFITKWGLIFLFFPVYLIYLALKKRNSPGTRFAPVGSTSQKGQAYEIACAERLKRKGYRNVQLTPATGDYGADIIAHDRRGRKVCFQCKRYSHNVGEDAVREVHSALAHYGANYGVVITNVDFTPKARELAYENGVELWPRFNAHLDWIDRVEEYHAFMDD